MFQLNNLPLAKIVSLYPGTVKVFEKHNLDFCCGGKQTLAEAMSGDQQKMKYVFNELQSFLLNNEKASEEIDFDKMSLSELIDYIVDKHHSFVKENNPIIYNHARRIADKHSDNHPELIQLEEVFAELKEELEQHMKKEELILFPRIKKIEAAYHKRNINVDDIHIASPINVMEAEHETVHLLLEEIKKLTHNYLLPKDACTTFRLCYEELVSFEKDLHVHIHFENNILFPKAIKMQEKLRASILN